MTTFLRLVLLGAFQLTAFAVLLVFVIPRSSQLFFLLSIIFPLLTPYEWSLWIYIFFQTGNLFPECLALEILGSLAIFSIWWRHSCACNASSNNAISVSCFQCYHMKPQRVKLIYIDKSQQNWRQLKFLSVLCAQNNKIFAWKPIPNSMNIQSQYFYIELLFSCCFSCRQTVQ